VNFTLRQIEYALAVAKYRSFSEAARACFVSQPALSVQVAQLETALGARLFERSTKPVSLTAFGEDFVRRGGALMKNLAELEAMARADREPLAGDLRLGVIPTVSPYLVPRIVGAIQKEQPACRLLLAEDQTKNLLARLDRGELDLLVLALEAELGAVETLELGRDPFWAAVPLQHPLAQKKEIALEELQQENLLLLEDGHCLSDQLRALCGMPSGDLGDFRAGSLSTLVQMVAMGHGVTLIPEMARASLSAALPELATRPLTRPAYRTIGLAWRPGHSRQSEFQLFGKILEPLFSPSSRRPAP
jgi:LysR family hydrogen peroxide-inducible transcriptional activator